MNLPFDWDPYDPAPPDGPISDFGWGSQDPFLIETFTPKTHLVIEVGSFHGASARYMARHLPDDAKVICVDTFCGDHEHWTHNKDLLHIRNGRAEFYEIFLRTNIAHGLQSKIFPLVMDSYSASRLLMDSRIINADLIYIDGGHDYRTVREDIQNYRALAAIDGYMVFDDFGRHGVRAAVEYNWKGSKITISPDGTKARVQNIGGSFI